MIDNLFLNKIDFIINNINSNRNILENNESQTRWLLIDYFLMDVLGYDRNDIFVEFDVEQDNRLSKYDKVDYSVVINNKVKIIIESKSLGSDLFSYKKQLENYFNNLLKNNQYDKEELIGILTDGNTYLLFTDRSLKGYMDENPFLNVTINNSDDHEILNLKSYSKSYLEKKEIDNHLIMDNTELYDLNNLYRIDFVESIINSYKSESIYNKIILDYVYFNNKKYNIKSFKSLYKHIIKYIINNYPNLLYEIIEDEEKSMVDGSIKNLNYYLNCKNKNMLEIKTNKGYIYTDINISDNIIISKIIYLLDKSKIGRFNLMLKLKKEC